LSRDSLKQIGERFGLDKYSSVSRVVERMKALISKDRRLRDRVEKLALMPSKSQEQV
jgi:chromosomal replication initiation ATPase DnaA